MPWATEAAADPIAHNVRSTFDVSLNYNHPPSLRMVAVPIRKLQLGWTTGTGPIGIDSGAPGAPLQCRRLGSDNTWVAFFGGSGW